MKKLTILTVIAIFCLINTSNAQIGQADIVSSVISNLVANPNSVKTSPIASALCCLGLGTSLTPVSNVTVSSDGKTSTYTATNGNAVVLLNDGTTNKIDVTIPSGGKLPVGFTNSLGGNPIITKSSTGDIKATIVSSDGTTNVKVYKDGHIQFSKTADAKCSM